MAITMDGSGRLQANRSGTVLGTSTNTISPNTWYYVELGVTIGSSGSYQIRVNGATWVSGSGNTQQSSNASANTVGLGSSFSPSSGGNLYYGDFYAADGTGSINNGFLGDCRVEVIFPNANGDVNQWTPNTGTNWGAVSQTNADGDSTFVSDATVGDRDYYKFGAL